MKSLISILITVSFLSVGFAVAGHCHADGKHHGDCAFCITAAGVSAVSIDIPGCLCPHFRPLYNIEFSYYEPVTVSFSEIPSRSPPSI